MKLSLFSRAQWGAAFCALLTLSALSALLVVLSIAGCGSGGSRTVTSGGSSASGGSSSASTRGKGAGTVAFTIKWPQSASSASSRLVPVASKAIRFTVTEYEAPNNVVVLTKVAARPADGAATSTVTLEGLPTVLVIIRADAYPAADATGVVQASGAMTVSVEQNKTIDKTITLDSTVKTVEVTAAAPASIKDGKLSLNLNDQTSADSIKASVTATAYNAAHEIVLTALNKWVYKSEKPSVATVSDPTQAQNRAQGSKKTRDEGISGSTVTITAKSAGASVITVTESESQAATQFTARVSGVYPVFWNQRFGDAQNSSCSPGPGTAGTVASSFTPRASSNGSGAPVGDASQFVEDQSGNIAFESPTNNSDASQDGVYVFTKSGTFQKHYGGPTVNANGQATTQAAISPVFGLDGTLYCVENDANAAHVVAQGPHTWDFTVQGGIFTYLTLSGDGGTLYFASEDSLIALDAATGTKIWQATVGEVSRYAASSGNGSKPAVSLDNSTVYIDVQGKVLALDAATGAKQWENAGTTSGTVFVGVGPTGTVYATSAAGGQISFRAIAPSTGNTLWSKDGFTGNYILTRTGVVVGSTALGQIEALDGASGTVLWTKGDTVTDTNFNGTFYISGQGAADGTIYAVENVFLSGGFYHVFNLVAVNAADGSTKWKLSPYLYSRDNGGVTQTSGYYQPQFVSQDGTLYAFNSLSPSPEGYKIDVIR